MNGRHVDWDAYADILGTDTDGGIARRIGCSESAVKAERIRRGIPSYSRRPLSGADLTRPTGELVAAYGVSPSAVCKARKAAGLTAPVKPRAGPRKGEWKRTARRAAKLTPPVVEVEEPAWRPFDPDAEPDPRWVAAFERRERESEEWL